MVDICNCLLVLIPAVAVQYGEGQWIFGSHLCYAYAVNQYTFSVANIVLINLLSLNKLLRCLHPLRNMHPTRFQRIMVPGLTSLISLIPMVWFIVGLVKDFMAISYLDSSENIYRIGTCLVLSRHSKTQNWVYKLTAAVLSTVCNGIFCLTLVITTTLLLVYAIRKTNRSINKKNIFIVIVVTVSFLLSFFPHFIFMMTVVSASTSHRKHLNETYTRSLTLLSSWINPMIYVVMNQSFREF